MASSLNEFGVEIKELETSALKGLLIWYQAEPSDESDQSRVEMIKEEIQRRQHGN